ncbi:MAG: hypothetical protein E5X37_05975 [Mesorhizobium sp.]|nr:MAG: hypothetical protein E5X37_05975 [Mesorhizobium sp.]
MTNHRLSSISAVNGIFIAPDQHSKLQRRAIVDYDQVVPSPGSRMPATIAECQRQELPAD